MKIERVYDKTVKCFLSNEELEEYEIDYKDFVTRSEKAREVVQEIIEQATEEVGYKPPKFAFDLQIMMMPKNRGTRYNKLKEVATIQNMREDYQILRNQFFYQEPADVDSFEKYLQCGRHTEKLASELDIKPESLKMQMFVIKKVVFEQTSSILIRNINGQHYGGKHL